MSPVNSSPLTDAAIHYAWRQLARLSGVRVEGASGFDSLDIDVFYAHPDRVESDDSGRACLIVVPCDDGAWQVLLDAAPDSLEHVMLNDALPRGATLNIDDPLPVLFRGAGYDAGHPFAALDGKNRLIFYVDILAAAFFMLSRWEETVLPERDRHGRFPADSSAAFKHNFLDRPLIDEYGLILQKWLQVLRPAWMPQRSTFRFLLSHDMDMPVQWAYPREILRTLYEDSVQQRSVKLLANSLRQIPVSMLRDYQHDLYYRGFAHLLARAGEYDVETAFYFMASPGGVYDRGYDPRVQPYRDMIEMVKTAGHEVGFHPGYSTFQNPDRFKLELERLQSALGAMPAGGRQHYLRFAVPDTWRLWQDSGLQYDSSLTYSSCEGFRCGTCHDYHPFDAGNDCEMRLVERPLIVMEGTLFDYRKLSPEEGQARILTLAEKCRRVGGQFTLLWHNSSLCREWENWVPVYDSSVRAIAGQKRPVSG